MGNLCLNFSRCFRDGYVREVLLESLYEVISLCVFEVVFFFRLSFMVGDVKDS